MKTVIPQAQKQTIPEGLSFENLIEELTEKDHLIEQKSHVIDEQKRGIAQLEEYLRLEKSRHYGPSRMIIGDRPSRPSRPRGQTTIN